MKQNKCEKCVFFEQKTKEASEEFVKSFAKELGTTHYGINIDLNDSKCFVFPIPVPRFSSDPACSRFVYKDE